MVYEPLQADEINVLVSESDWDWPLAVRSVFSPRGVNMLLAKRAGDVAEIIRQKRIHTAIVDLEADDFSGMGVIRVIRSQNPLLPCILLAETVEKKILTQALEMEIFSVLEKPVQLEMLERQLDRLFRRRYNSDVFGS